jgi:hypothetical protein
MKVQVIVEGFKLNATYHFMFYSDDIILLGKYITIINITKGYFLVVNMKANQEVRAEETNYRAQMTLHKPTQPLK